MGRIRVQTGARERSNENEVERQKAKHNENKRAEVNHERGTGKEDGQVLRCPADGEVGIAALFSKSSVCIRSQQQLKFKTRLSERKLFYEFPQL